MPHDLPFLIFDSQLTPDLAALAFDRFSYNAPALDGNQLRTAFSDLMTAIRHPYTTALQALNFERDLDRRTHQSVQEAANQTLLARLATAQSEIHILNTKVLSLQTQYAAVKSGFQGIRTERNQLRADLQRVRTERDAFENQLQVAQAENHDLVANIHNLQMERQILENNLTAAEKLFQTELKGAQSETRTTLTILRERTDAMNASNKAMVENLEAQVAFLRREVLDLRTNNGVDTTGSKSRSETWSNVKTANPQRMCLPLAHCPALPDDEMESINALVAHNYPAEKDMYTPFASVVGNILDTARTVNSLGARVIDTHNTQYLGVYSPDITVSIGGLRNPDSSSVYLVIELKHTKVRLEGKELGQAYDYALAIRAAQGHRRFHVVMLSNFLDTQFVLLDSKDATTRHFLASNLAHAISYIKHVVLNAANFSPRVPAFSLSLGDMVGRLATSKHSVVYEYDAPAGVAGMLTRLFPDEECGGTMAVKRSSDSSKSSDIEHEIQILTKIKSYSGNNRIARLVYTSPQKNELGVMPVGARIDPLDLSEYNAIAILTDVLEALKWLHQRNIIHRDVRLDNIVLYKGHARLIDLGAAIELPAAPGMPYWGGYLCCPPELVGDFSLPYTPCKEHDLLAFVMMACLMAFPHSLKSMSSKQVGQRSPESYRLIRFWARLNSSSVWGPFVQAAKKADYERLAKVADLFAVL